MASDDYNSQLASAKNEFISNLATTAGITADDAETVFDYYKAHRIIKFDAFGKIAVIRYSEIWWDKDTILNILHQ